MSKRTVIILLIIGIIIGAAGTHYLPGRFRSYLPESITGKLLHVKGTVIAKERKPNLLRVTVNTPQGALLATFTENVDETDLLLNPNDAVEMGLKKYEPFIADPEIYRVVKGGPIAAPLQESVPTGTAVTGPSTTKAARPRTPSRKEHRPRTGE